MKRSKYIDHTLLKATASKEDIKKLCEEALAYDFQSVCVNSCWVSYCKQLLENTNIKICCVVGFPLGAMSSSAKAYEASNATQNGASEIDMVMNVGMFKSNMDEEVLADIMAVRKACGNNTLKLILETCYLDDEEIKMACELGIRAGVDYVKTSTGFGSGGASIHDIKLMKEAVNKQAKIKASGGIRSKKDMDEMIEAGAERIGASCSLKLI